MWKKFLHDFYESVIVSNWKVFWNIHLFYENVASTLLLSDVIKKGMSNLLPLRSKNIR